MTPEQLAYAVQGMSDEQLAKMPHWMLYQARAKLPADQQDRVAAFEHRAYAREQVQDNPLMAPVMAAGAIAYQPLKMLLGQSRSHASFGQIGAGLQGVYEGLTKKPTDNVFPPGM